MTVATRAYAVRWKDCPRWDIKTAKATLFRLAHPDFRPLGDFAEEATEIVRPMDKPDHDWPVYGVNNTAGVFLNQYQKGEKFNAPYKRIRKDWFFHNPTRANVGSLGRVPDVPDDAITSPEYQVWRLRGGLIPAFVEILIKTRFFIDLIDCHRVGAVKQRLFVGNLLEIPVPDVPLSVQRRIVSAWKRAQGEVVDTRRRIAELEKQIEADFLTDLGIDSGALQQRGRLIALPWSAIDRWGVGFNRWDWTVEDLLASRYPSRPLAEVATINPILGRRLSSDAKVSFVAMEALDGESGRITEAIDRPYRDVRNGFTAFRDGDVIWAKITPCMQNGKCAVAGNMTNGVGFGSTEFHVIRPHDVETLDTTFLWAILRLRRLREAARRYFIGSAGQQRVPPDFLETLHVPLPPLPVQRELVAKVSAQRQKIAALKAEADAKAERAEAEVEAMILGEREATR